MGSCFSCISLSSTTLRPPPTSRCVRLVHVSGFVEEFPAAISARQIVGHEPKHFICLSSQLRSINPRPLALDAVLLPGELYFLLPLSAFQSDASPLDLASLLARNTAAIKRADHMGSQPTLLSRLWRRRRSDDSAVEPHAINSEDRNPLLMKAGSRTQAWKPVLEAISEGSFRKIES